MIRNYLTFLVLTILALSVARFFNVSLPVSVTTSTIFSEFSVIGEGKVDVVPDTAYIDTGITISDANSVEKAQKSITDTNNKIINAMKALDIPKENITTSHYSIFPNYDYSTANENRVTGYSGNVTITIKVKDPQLASRVIEEATKAGANQIQGTRFIVDNPNKYREEAREEAIKNAREQAERLAKSLGIRLGKVTNIVEGSSGSMMSRYDTLSVKESMGGGGPAIEPGSQTITSVVTLFFEKR